MGSIFRCLDWTSLLDSMDPSATKRWPCYRCLVDRQRLLEYVAGYDRRQSVRRDETRERVQVAQALVPGLAALCRRAGAKKVRLFGSLVTGRYGSTPDVDLAIDGLPADRFFDVLAELQVMAAPTEVDLVDLARCSTELRARVEAEGIDA